jgi:hypothetical protein
MRWIIFPILWIAAIVVALLILRRVRRGRPVVLTGRFSPRLVRMIVVILVLVGVGGESNENKTNAYPLTPLKDNPNDPMPTLPVSYWLHHHSPSSSWGQFKKGMAAAMMKDGIGATEATDLANLATSVAHCPGFYAMFNSDLHAFKKGQDLSRIGPKEVLAALDQMEKYGFYDHWLCAHLWRRTRTDDPIESADLAKLYARLQQHARVTNALISAHAQVRPPMEAPHAWASKAGPRPGEMEQIKAFQRAQNDVLVVATRVYPASDEGTWKRDGLIQLSPVKDSPAPNVIKAGKLKGFPEGEKTRVGRLDLLEAPKDKRGVLEHEWLGRIELPAGRVVAVRDLPNYLSKDGSAKLKTVIDKALNGDEKAADQLEKVLPLAHAGLRTALKDVPRAKGAPRMRMILSLFDDAIMPQLKPRQPDDREISEGPPSPLEELGGFGRAGPGRGGFDGGGGVGGGGFGGGGGGRAPIPDPPPKR